MPRSAEYAYDALKRTSKTPTHMEVHILPTALVTGSPERLTDITVALKSAGFDILSAGPMSLDPLLAPRATVLLVTEGSDRLDDSIARSDPDQKAVRTLVGVLAEAILRDCGRSGVRTAVVAEGRAPEEIAALASHRPPEPLPWWLYATVDPDLDFADWRNSVLCLTSMRDG